MIESPICSLCNIQYPIFQGGMAWIADGELAAAVSNGGGLGIISAMNAGADYLKQQIQIAKSLTDKPFGVNVMLMSPHAAEVAEIIAQERVAVVTTGAGNPSKYMPAWKEAGIVVIPVIASVAMAKKVQKAGADAVIAEGQESGGHIGDDDGAGAPDLRRGGYPGDCGGRDRRRQRRSRSVHAGRLRRAAWHPVPGCQGMQRPSEL